MKWLLPVFPPILVGIGVWFIATADDGRSDITTAQKVELCAGLRKNLDADAQTLVSTRETNALIASAVLPKYPDSPAHAALVFQQAQAVAANTAAQNAHDDVERDMPHICPP